MPDYHASSSLIAMARRTGRRRRSTRRRGPRRSSITETNYFSTPVASTTSFHRSTFPILAGMGDRAFTLRGVSCVFESPSPVLLNVRAYGPAQTSDSIAASGVRLCGPQPRRVRLSFPRGAATFTGSTAQSATLLAIDVLAPSATRPLEPATGIVRLTYTVAPPELSSRVPEPPVNHPHGERRPSSSPRSSPARA